MLLMSYILRDVAYGIVTRACGAPEAIDDGHRRSRSNFPSTPCRHTRAGATSSRGRNWSNAFARLRRDRVTLIAVAILVVLVILALAADSGHLLLPVQLQPPGSAERLPAANVEPIRVLAGHRSARAQPGRAAPVWRAHLGHAVGFRRRADQPDAGRLARGLASGFYARTHRRRRPVRDQHARTRIPPSRCSWSSPSCFSQAR